MDKPMILPTPMEADSLADNRFRAVLLSRHRAVPVCAVASASKGTRPFEHGCLVTGREQRRGDGRQLRQRERGSSDPESDEDCRTGPEFDRVHGVTFPVQSGFPRSAEWFCARRAAAAMRIRSCRRLQILNGSHDPERILDFRAQ
jgi:hypothetical protein